MNIQALADRANFIHKHPGYARYQELDAAIKFLDAPTEDNYSKWVQERLLSEVEMYKRSGRPESEWPESLRGNQLGKKDEEV